MSATVDELTESVGRLGPAEAEFKASASHYLLCLIGGAFVFLLGVALLVFLAVGLLLAPQQKIRSAFLVLKMVVGGSILIGAGWRLWRRGRAGRGLRVVVCSEGLARIQGNRAELLRWEDVNRVQRAVNVKAEGVTVRSPVQLTVVGREGVTMTFDESLAGLRSRELVERHTLPHMLPPALEALAAGETIAFGALALGPQGIQHGAETLPWERFAEAEAAQGQVIVRAREARRPFCTVDIAEVPNAHVFVALAEQARYRYA